jgi:hypothetical protein
MKTRRESQSPAWVVAAAKWLQDRLANSPKPVKVVTAPKAPVQERLL